MILGINELIRAIPAIEQKSFGERPPLVCHAGTPDDPIPMPHVSSGNAERLLIEALGNIVEENPQLDLRNYQEVLSEYGLEWSDESLRSADVSTMDARGIIALVLALVRADRFNEGIMIEYLEEGIVLGWLKELERRIG